VFRYIFINKPEPEAAMVKEAFVIYLDSAQKRWSSVFSRLVKNDYKYDDDIFGETKTLHEELSCLALDGEDMEKIQRENPIPVSEYFEELYDRVCWMLDRFTGLVVDRGLKINN
jgi:hypothetical protein